MPNTQVSVSTGVGLSPAVTISYLEMADLLWVLEGDTVQIRSRDNLTIIKSFGSTGAGDDQFATPTALCADQESVYVLDGGNSRIKKHVGKTGTYQAQAAITWVAGGMTARIVVDRLRLLFGETAVNTYVYDRNKNTFAEEHAYFDCGDGPVVGLAVTDGYFFVATATRVEKRLMSDGSLIATWNAVPAGFAVAGLTADATYIYVLCTQIAVDCKIIKLYQTDLFEHSSDDMTGKVSPIGICCDDTYVYFLNLADTTVNRVDNDLDPASLLTSGGVTGAMNGLCCQPPYYEDLPEEPVDDIVVTGSMAMAGTAVMGSNTNVVVTGAMAMAGTAVVVKPSAVVATGAMAMAGTAVVSKPSVVVVTGAMAMAGTAVVSKDQSLTVTGAMAMGGSAVVELGAATIGGAVNVAATVGLTAVNAVATVRY